MLRRLSALLHLGPLNRRARMSSSQSLAHLSHYVSSVRSITAVPFFASIRLLAYPVTASRERLRRLHGFERSQHGQSAKRAIGLRLERSEAAYTSHHARHRAYHIVPSRAACSTTRVSTELEPTRPVLLEAHRPPLTRLRSCFPPTSRASASLSMDELGIQIDRAVSRRLK